ncbi:Gfo/Idh/MocA family protein [Pseudalkalibacillus sp. R45]|uniref:Gfo/Idh/MocA family protein n=1 Tax=Pseudalkalibacillus sp. R45 TaxID=3457433 RepID=UPI003FCD7EA6
MQTPFSLNYKPKLGQKQEYGIGIIGAGFIIKECHLPAYEQAGYNIIGIYNRTREKAEQLAKDHSISNVYDSLDELLSDPKVEVVDIAVPPHEQLNIIRQAAEHGKHILAQKPLGMNYEEAEKAVEICKKHGVKLVVNQNGRYDPAIQGTKHLIDEGYIGKPVMATIELRFQPHWQPYQLEYERLMFLFMSIHHLDQFRLLFGVPKRIYASSIPHPEGLYKGEYITSYILEYENGMMANAWDDGFTWDPESFGVFYKIEGTVGVIKLDIGWPSGGPSTISFYSKKLEDQWHNPELEGNWFPGAFQYTMGELFHSIETGEESSISGENNLLMMAMVEACYLSNKDKKAIEIDEIVKSSIKI